MSERAQIDVSDAAGTVLEVTKVDEFDHKVVFKLSNGKKSVLYTFDHATPVPQVGDVLPAEVVQDHERGKEHCWVCGKPGTQRSIASVADDDFPLCLEHEQASDLAAAQIDREQWYRKNPVSINQIVALVNKTQRTMTAAVVFSFGKEFNFVTNQKDAGKLLEYGDPVGVVGIGGKVDGKEPKPVFTTFKGHDWAKKHAKKIIKQAKVVVDGLSTKKCPWIHRA